MTDEIVTGERLQEICDLYCGLIDDFQYNPRIAQQTTKHFNLMQLTDSWKNPSILFCYGHQLKLFMEKRNFLQNPYWLVTHNSDENITEQYRPLLDDPKLQAMISQNVCIEHPKLHILPIGIANSMWNHGNLTPIKMLMTFSAEKKSRDLYFHFNMNTNRLARELCYKQISAKGFTFEQPKSHMEYLLHLSKHKFAICPEGNGIDSHRIWECYYLGVIPIVHKSVFTQKLRQILPCILLDNWSDLNLFDCLQQYYTLYNELMEKHNMLKLSYFENMITKPIR